MRTISGFILFLGLLALHGCGGEERMAIEAPSPAEALAALARQSGSPWQARLHDETGVVSFLIGRTAPLDAPDRWGRASREFLLHHGALFGLQGEEAELSHAATTTDPQGMQHLRFTQVRNRVPIWGSALTIHLDRQGRALRVHGWTVPARPGESVAGEDARAQAVLSADGARQEALALLQEELPDASLATLAPDLVYLYEGPGRPLALVYRVEVEGQDGDLTLRREVFLDARTGTTRRQGDLTAAIAAPMPATGSGLGALGERRALRLTRRDLTFTLEDPGRQRLRTLFVRKGERLPGRTVSSKDPARWDEDGPGAGVAVDVHAHLGTIWDYYAQQHGIHGWQNSRIVSAVVHVGDRLPLALFDGRRLLFGDGDGAAYLPLGAALDVVAHEYSHALLRELSDLAPDGESRAIEEGGADLFACLIEQAAQPAQGGWTIGEQIHRSEGLEAPIRDLIDPRRSDQARSLAEVRGSAMSDSKSRGELAHFSSGIVGHAGYLMARQLGNARTAAVLRRAFSTYLFHFAGFSDFADATLMAVQDLHGSGGPEARAVARSWAAVGVDTIETIGESANP